MTIICMSGMTAFAAETLYSQGIRDGDVQIMLPAGWYLEEAGSISEDENALEGGAAEYSTEVAEFFDADGTSTATLYMLYQEDPEFTAEDFATLIGAKDYYQEEGRTFLKEYLSDLSGGYRLDEGFRIIGPSEESDNTLICATATGKKELRIYLIKNTDHLLGILSFNGRSGRMPDETLTDRIAGSLTWEDYDLGLYERTYTRDDVEWADDEDEGFDGGLILVIIFILAVIGMSVMESGENDGTKRVERMREHLPGRNIGNTEVREERPARPTQVKDMRKKEATLFDRLPDRPREKRVHQHPDGIFEPGHGKKRVHQHPDGTRETAHYSGYLESLKTLRKSGLVTREEYYELLDRHKRNQY